MAPNLQTSSIDFADREGEGVKKCQHSVDVVYGSPQMQSVIIISGDISQLLAKTYGQTFQALVFAELRNLSNLLLLRQTLTNFVIEF